MKRELDLNAYTDGKLYTQSDLVKLGCDGCKGRESCCMIMEDTILLDPKDIYDLTGNLNLSFEDLMKEKIELHVVDGVILPNLRMVPYKSVTACGFLSEEGRCSIHDFRPGFCRMFPLGRIYDEDGSFHYFHQIHECPCQNTSKVKIKNWLQIEGLSKYEAYIKSWHDFLMNVEKIVEREMSSNESKETPISQKLNLLLLNTFFVTPYGFGENTPDFYSQFEERLKKLEEIIPYF